MNKDGGNHSCPEYIRHLKIEGLLYGKYKEQGVRL